METSAISERLLLHGSGDGVRWSAGCAGGLPPYILWLPQCARWKDRTAATIAGLAAILVASFPTGVPGGVQAPSWWTERIGLIHGAAATVLFASFIFFSLFLFTRSGTPKPQAGKQARNAIYIICGLAMTVCMVWAIAAALRKAPIFWPETLALELFALSWLVKGRAVYTAGVVVSRTFQYGRHPHLLL